MAINVAIPRPKARIKPTAMKKLPRINPAITKERRKNPKEMRRNFSELLRGSRVVFVACFSGVFIAAS